MKATLKPVPLILATIILLTSTFSNGTTLLALDLDSLTQLSDDICTGHILDQTSFMREGRIYTLHRVRVETNIKGKQSQGTVIEVVTAGGHSELFSQKVFGAAELQAEKTYLLFLENRGIPDVVHPVGMSQGALPISIESTTRKATVHPSGIVPRLLSRDSANGQFRPTAPWLTKARQLDEIITEIRTIIGGTR